MKTPIKLKFAVISLFPEIFNNLFGLIQTARDSGLFHLEAVDLREFGRGKHKKVDDQVYGGSDGMLLCPDVLLAAINHIKDNPDYKNAKVIALTPKGEKWSQQMAQEWSQDTNPKILVCGRYAGFDQRFLSSNCDQEISIGDFILNGGEVAALAIFESVGRLLPEALGNQLSIEEDSFSSANGALLEAPQYTRPAEWNGLEVPDILTSGHHLKISNWKKMASYIETLIKRPDLICNEDKAELKKYFEDKVIFESLEKIYTQDELSLIKKDLG